MSRKIILKREFAYLTLSISLIGCISAQGSSTLVTPVSKTSESTQNTILPPEGATPLPGTVDDTNSNSINSSTTFTSAESTLCNPFGTFLGTYYWGTGYSDTYNPTMGLADGVSLIANKGFATVRIALIPADLENSGKNAYGISPPHCPANQFLPCAIQLAPYQAVLTNPNISTLILTAHDSTTFGQNGYATNFNNLTYLNANANTVIKEYSDLIVQISKSSGAQTKTIIIDQWEGDNLLYCGSAYGYATDPNAKLKCDSYFASNLQVSNAQNAMNAFTKWFQLRKQGIQQGVALAKAAGHPVDVRDGIEFNSYQMLHNMTPSAPSVLYNVIPVVQPAVVSYSSYESINRATFDTDLTQIQHLLTSTSPASQLGIGELGFSFQNSSTDYGTPFALAQTLETARRHGLLFGIIWETFNSQITAGPGYGFLNPDGSDRIITGPLSQKYDLYQTLSSVLSQPETSPSNTPGLQISSYTDGVKLTANQSGGFGELVRLYGDFSALQGIPLNNIFVASNCHGNINTVAPISASGSEVDVIIPMDLTEKPWCTVQLKTSSLTSPVFGPMLLNTYSVSSPTTPFLSGIVNQGQTNGIQTFTLYGLFPGTASNYQGIPNLNWSAACYGFNQTPAQIRPVATQVSFINSATLRLQFSAPQSAPEYCIFKVLYNGTSGEVQSNTTNPMLISP